MITINWSLEHPNLRIGLVVAAGVQIGPSDDELNGTIDTLLATRGPDVEWPPDGVKKTIRDLLRHGGYKPAGRGKPASEYLAGAAKKQQFPRINNLVDINNLLSLQTGWPMSMLDLDRARGEAEALEIRFGRDDERYAFNSTGQEIALSGLLGIARVDGPMLGNPVKDSMMAKTQDDSSNAFALIYTDAALASDLEIVAARYAHLIVKHAHATAVDYVILSDPANSATAATPADGEE